MSRPARKPTLWSLRKVSTRVSLSMTHFASCGFSVSGIINIYLYPPVAECVGPVSLLGLRRLIWLYTLRRVHDAGFLVELLICCLTIGYYEKSKVVDVTLQTCLKTC